MTESSYTIKPGFISDRVRTLPASGIRRFFELIANMDGVISLGVGEPHFVTPERFSQAAFRAVAQGETHYTSNYGLPELREAVSDHLERLYSVRYDPRNEILITIGVSEGLMLAVLAVLNPGDELLSPDPYYVAYLPVCPLAGGVFVGNIARWDGANWADVSFGVDGEVFALAPANIRGPGLYVGGIFTVAGGRDSPRIAKWAGCEVCYADCDGNGELDIFDFLCFQNSFVLGEPYACDCDPDPACDIFDFLCFQNAFVAGCP